jgi:hypothetical protein
MTSPADEPPRVEHKGIVAYSYQELMVNVAGLEARGYEMAGLTSFKGHMVAIMKKEL